MVMPRVDEQLCFALYSASRAMASSYRPMLDELGLTYPQYLVMLVLWEDDRATVGRLGDRLHLDSGTLSPLLKRLENQGYVVRERSSSDERVVDVRLTPAGRALARRARPVPQQAFAATGMTPEEAAELRDSLRHLADVLNAPRRKESP